MKITLPSQYRLFLSFLFLASSFICCDSLIEVDTPGTNPSDKFAFRNDTSAISTVRGMYSEMAANPYFSNAAISLLAGLSADELASSAKDYLPYFHNTVTKSDSLVKLYCWTPGYRYIYNANAILEGLDASVGVTKVTKNQLRAEALFIRAFSHFYLTNLFGAIPLVTNTDLNTNLHIHRTAPEQVYGAIEADLLNAQQLFSEDQDLILTKDAVPRSRANYWAATALLARVYLYQEKWAAAEQQATLVLEKSLFSLSALEDVFKSSSEEAIWQILPVLAGQGTYDALVFTRVPDETPTIYLTESFVQTIEPNDLRTLAWIDTVTIDEILYYTPSKYKDHESQTEFHIELRLAEMYLIRAEARVHQNNIAAAIEDVDVLRTRAMLPSLKDQSLTSDALLQKIAQERRIELFTESGHRWLDLKRTNSATVLLSALAYKEWQDTDVLYPVPQSEIVNNPNLGPQNQGY
jgi:hypothetical protein